VCILSAKSDAVSVWTCDEVPTWCAVVWWCMGSHRYILEQHRLHCLALQWQV